MSAKLQTVYMTENAEKAAKKMRDKHISSLLVINNDKVEESPVGIVTERDLVNRVCAEGLSSRQISVGEIMSSPIATVERGATVETAADLMLQNKVRHLLVIDDQTRKAVGIVAPSDLNRYLQGNTDWDEVSARILEAIQAEEPSQLVRARQPNNSTIRKLSGAEEKAVKVAGHFMCYTCGAIFTTEQDRRKHLREEKHSHTRKKDKN
jgi:CBS domain-containing protein